MLWIRIQWIRIKIQHFKVNPDPGYGWPKLEKKNAENLLVKSYFDKKIVIYLSLGLHKGRPSYRRSLQPSKENIHHFKRWNLLAVSYFSGSFLSSWIHNTASHSTLKIFAEKRLIEIDIFSVGNFCPYFLFIFFHGFSVKSKHCKRTLCPMKQSNIFFISPLDTQYRTVHCGSHIVCKP